MKTQSLLIVALSMTTVFAHAAPVPTDTEITRAVAWGLGPKVSREEMRRLMDKLAGLAEKHMAEALFLNSYGDNSLSSALAVGSQDDWNVFEVEPQGDPGWTAVIIGSGEPLVSTNDISNIQKVSFDGKTFIGSFRFERKGLFKGRCIFSLWARQTGDGKTSWRLMKMAIANRLTDKLDMGKVVYRH